VEAHDPRLYGESFADVYDDWYGDLGDLDATVALLADLADGGPVLELGVGTGRLALPLAGRGLEVHGIDASEAMVARLQAKPGSERVRVTVGDMTTPLAPGGADRRFALVFVANNTLFNLPTGAGQAACFAGVAAVLRPGGCFVVEAFVPSDDPDGPTGGVEARTVALDHVVLTVTKRDPTTQTVAGQHVEIRESGIRLRPWVLRYAHPAELDGMAAAAGLALAERWAGWRREPFGADSGVHVSVYRRR
jgi:SAM-dependent methyltransferase